MSDANNAQSNIHTLPKDIFNNDEDKHPVDDYDKSNKELLVDMDAEEKKDPDVKSEKKWTMVASFLLAAIMLGSYFSYDAYKQYEIEKSAKLITAIESADGSNKPQSKTNDQNTNIKSTQDTSTPTIRQSKESPGLLGLINSDNPSIIEQAEVKGEIIVNTVEKTRDIPSEFPTTSKKTFITASQKVELEETLTNLNTITETLKTAVSELTFQVDQNNERMNIAMQRIVALESVKTPSSQPAKTTIVASKKRTAQSTTAWLNNASVTSVRKIGTKFIAKIKIEGTTIKLSPGESHQGWKVSEVDLDSGRIDFLSHKNNSLRSLFL